MSSEKMRADWRECHGKIIGALARMVNCPQTDEQVEAELIPRGPIMAGVVHVREALDAYAAGQRDAQADTNAQAQAMVDAAIARGAGQRAAVPEWPKGVLNRQTTLDILKQHNEWRRGAETTQTDPRMLGLALDAAIAMIAASRGPDSALEGGK